MLNRDGITKKSYVNVRQILANVDLQSSVGCIVPQSLVPEADANGKKIAKAGTPININLSNLQAAVRAVSGTSSEESATATVTGTGITAASVVAATFGSKVGSAAGSYEFVAAVDLEATTWKLGSQTVELNTYGITATGTAADGDKITVVYTPTTATVPINAVLLHDVDVTSGNANGTALLFGFVNVNRVDSDVATAIATAQAIAGASPLLTFMSV